MYCSLISWCTFIYLFAVIIFVLFFQFSTHTPTWHAQFTHFLICPDAMQLVHCTTTHFYITGQYWSAYKDIRHCSLSVDTVEQLA